MQGKQDREKARIEQLLQTSNPFKQYYEDISNDVLEGEQNLEYKGIKIKKRKDGYWYARIPTQTINKYDYLYNKNQKQLYIKLKEVMDSKLPKKDRANYKTLEQWIDDYYLLYKTGIVKDSTLKEIKSEFKNFAPLYKKAINKISSQDLKNIIYNMQAKRQAEKVYIHGKELFEKAKANKLIKVNPFDEVVKPIHTKIKESKAFTLLQQNIIEERLINDKQYAILFSLYQGTRIGETLAIKFSNIKENEIDIHNAINVHKNIQDELNTPKTKTSYRTIPLFDKTKELIKVLNTNNSEDEFIFKATYQSCQRYFKNLMQELGYKGFTLHSTRHTFATRALEKGLNIKTISKWLGHYSSDITNKVYLHINKDFEQSEINKINH